MSLEFVDPEEPLSQLGSLIVAVCSAVVIIYGAMGSMLIGGGTATYDSPEVGIITYSEIPIGYTFLLMFIMAILVCIIAVLSFARNWMKVKINTFVGAICSLLLFNMMTVIVPGEPIESGVSVVLLTLIWIGIAGTAIVLISKRPKLGKESNKHIFQAYGSVMIVIIGMLIIVLGIYVLTFDVGDFAGKGTFPGDSFETAYLYDSQYPGQAESYAALRMTGWVLIIGAIIVIISSIIRNAMSLYFASLVILGGIVTIITGVGLFFLNWTDIDNQFRDHYVESEYKGQLRLADPVFVNIGIVLILYMFIGVIMIMYSAQQSEPLEKWRNKRNTMLAAAEVAIRDQKLQKAVSYLERGSIWSSKLGEEDRAVELITRINNIKEKAIKMRKAEAAERKKRELDAAKKKAAAKAPKMAKGPKTAKSAETKPEE